MRANHVTGNIFTNSKRNVKNGTQHVTKYMEKGPKIVAHVLSFALGLSPLLMCCPFAHGFAHVLSFARGLSPLLMFCPLLVALLMFCPLLTA